tara:strand:+ start:905 stop:1021 length:117 start_codon:yes stop_codon:yes gene_type:complete
MNNMPNNKHAAAKMNGNARVRIDWLSMSNLKKDNFVKN